MNAFLWRPFGLILYANHSTITSFLCLDFFSLKFGCRKCFDKRIPRLWRSHSRFRQRFGRLFSIKQNTKGPFGRAFRSSPGSSQPFRQGRCETFRGYFLPGFVSESTDCRRGKSREYYGSALGNGPRGDCECQWIPLSDQILHMAAQDPSSVIKPAASTAVSVTRNHATKEQDFTDRP